MTKALRNALFLALTFVAPAVMLVSPFGGTVDAAVTCCRCVGECAGCCACCGGQNCTPGCGSYGCTVCCCSECGECICDSCLV